MLILIDNYESLTYNLVHYIDELDAEVEVVRNDKATVTELLARRPSAVVLSPGPCDPGRAGICLDMIGACARAAIPLLGEIEHTGTGVFAGLPSPFRATRDHSLIVARDSIPDALEVTAWLADGAIMGLAHRALPIHGVQFHPESLALEHGHALLRNFLDLAKVPA